MRSNQSNPLMEKDIKMIQKSRVRKRYNNSQTSIHVYFKKFISLRQQRLLQDSRE